MSEERILLVDIDSTIPNLALMKVSAHYKALGHEVGFNVENPTKIYASTIFTRNRHKTDGLHFFYPDADIDIAPIKAEYEGRIMTYTEMDTKP